MSVSDSENERHLGDYRLKQLLADNGQVAAWLAEQVSVGRTVIVDELQDLSGASRERFLTDTRARAAVDHPFIASVYEAVDETGFCMRASERLIGESMQEMLDGKITIEPARMARMLRCVAEANLHHETNARSTLPMSPRYVHVDGGGEITRIVNLAVAGHRADDESARDVMILGRELVPLVAEGRPGTTRILTILAWMRGKERPVPLQWQEIIDLCDQVDRQLSAPIGATPVDAADKESQAGTRAVLLLGGFTLAVMLVIMLFAWMMRPPKAEPLSPAHLPPVLIPAGEYPAFDGTSAVHEAFLIDARETTIAEYREFLEILDVLAADDRHRAFDHPDQPGEKTHHEPADWPALLAAARGRGFWNGKPVSLNSPVLGVDWWDAVAYANWRKARLPTQEEWSAAIHHQSEDPGGIPAGDWHAVTPADCPDRTATGILGVAGSLAEWTRSASISPANPLGAPQQIIIGGSYLKPGTNALSREWAMNRELRRPDLGFRLVRSIDVGE
ncbi:MAG: SUMF1/EgtB/PvdO family nonheme iron enzyme [Luteolibacter sp.]|jgi:formylglycine-generating enzyme required for sulfatase activity